jgi:hypothetical protein
MPKPPSVLYECSTADPTANTELRARESAVNTCTRNFGFVANLALSKFANLNNILSAKISVVNPLTVLPSTAQSTASAAILRMYRPMYLKHWALVLASASLS